jgi:DNA-binding IclR family transcriptional regulator
MSIVAVERALVILKIVSQSAEGAGVRAVARQLGYSPGVVQKSLQALAAQGFVEQDPSTQTYRLGPEAVMLGLIALGRMDIRRAARPILERLVRATGETSMIGVPRGDIAVYVDQVSSPNEVRMNVPVGAPRPFNCTAVGKALLAHRPDDDVDRLYSSGAFRQPTANSIGDVAGLRGELARIRESGFSIDAEEFLIGARCVAAPVRDFEGEVVAAVAVSGPAERMAASEGKVIAEVRRAAADISEALGARSGSREEVSA